MFKFLFPLLEEPGDNAGAGAGEDNFEADLSFLNDESDDEKKDDNNDDSSNKEDEEKDSEGDAGDDKDSEEDDEKDKDDKDDEEEDEKDKEDDEEDEQELARHSYKDIKAKYPEIFKDFPGLKTAFFREQEFTKLFPNLEDAKEAIEAKENFDGLRDTVISGDAKSFLSSVKRISGEALEGFAGNFLDSLREIDKDTYIEVTSPVIQNVFRQIFKTASHRRDKNLGNAAILAYQEIFGGEIDEIPQVLAKNIKPEKKEESPESKKLRSEAEELLRERRDDLHNIAWSEISRELTREIEKGLDPNNAIRPGLKKLIVEKIFAEVTKDVGRDQQHLNRMDEIWKRAHAAKYRGAFKDSLKTTYLSRAKALVPKFRQKIKAELMSSQKSSDKNREEKLKKAGEKKDIQPGAKTVGAKTKFDPKDPKLKTMSDLDILNT